MQFDGAAAAQVGGVDDTHGGGPAGRIGRQVRQVIRQRREERLVQEVVLARGEQRQVQDVHLDEFVQEVGSN